jgi:hypothetical protein
MWEGLNILQIIDNSITSISKVFSFNLWFNR